jgi:hypothetical protein
VLTLENYLLILYVPMMLDPNRHVALNPKPQFICGEGPSKNEHQRQNVKKNIAITFIAKNKQYIF